LIPADLDRIRRQLAPGAGLLGWAHQHLLASPGALVEQGASAFRIPTLVPARRPEGGCLFLTTVDRCAIHASAPFGYAFFDDHMEAAEADRRSRLGLQAILEAWRSGSLYGQVWLVLQEAGLQAPPPEVCRRQFRQAGEPERPP